MASRFEPNRAGIAELGRSPGMQAAMEHKAELVRIRAEEFAPIRTGHYAFNLPNPADHSHGGFQVTSGVQNGAAYGRVTNSTRYASFLEFGTRYMKKQRILGRALDAIRR